MLEGLVWVCNRLVFAQWTKNIPTPKHMSSTAATIIGSTLYCRSVMRNRAIDAYGPDYPLQTHPFVTTSPAIWPRSVHGRQQYLNTPPRCHTCSLSHPLATTVPLHHTPSLSHPSVITPPLHHTPLRHHTPQLRGSRASCLSPGVREIAHPRARGSHPLPLTVCETSLSLALYRSTRSRG